MDLITSPTVENFQSDNIPSTDPTTNPSPEKQLVEADPNENSSANSSLNKMESLLVQEDDNDENDHGLGTESLRLSGSDDEDDDDLPTVRRKKGPTQRIVESDDDDDGKVVNKDNIEESGEMEQNPSEFTEVASKPNKFSALIDSESEPELTEEALKAPKKSVKDMKKKKKNSEKTKKNKPSPSVDSSSESEEEPSKQKSKFSDLVDSESETSNAGSVNEDENQNEGSKKQPSQRPRKPQRASAKKAIDEMQAIQSETQRLYRETQVNIPYHKPKRHTLKEFLTRRTIAKPTLIQNGPGKSLKMTPEELEEYAKHLEERAKEATEFFKSESEDELKDVQDEESTTEKPTEQPEEPMNTSTSENKQSEEQSETTRPLTTQEIDQILEDHEFISQPSTQDILGDIQTESESQSAPSVEPGNATKPSALAEQSTPSTSSAASVHNNTAKPSALAELKRRLIAEKNIPLVPKLKGDSNMIIDFETGDMFARKPTGVENLFERFMKSNKNNKKKPEDPTPSQELQTTLKVAVIQESNKEKEPKPGAAYVKLKENLRALISRKRKEEFRKKVEESKEEEEEYNKCCGLDDDDEDEEEEKEPRSKPQNREKDIIIDDEENEIELEEDCEIDEEDEETEPTEDQTNAELKEGAPAEENMEVNQAEDEDEEDESDSSSSSSSDEDETNTEDPSTRKHRVIKAFQDSDDETGPGLNETSTSVLYVEEEQKNPEDVETELLGLCSGQFAETQAGPVISQIPITQTPGNVTETELEDLCSGVFNEANTQAHEVEMTQVEKPHKTVMRIVSSDEEKEPDEEPDVKKVKKLKKKKKKHVKLGFSDDEEDDDDDDDDDQEGEQNSVDENDQEEDEEEIPQTFIDYDSEENEIEVQMSKKDCVKKANGFLENEAELSESEWGSADEDERNLDKYDMELGDEDEFDQQKLHSELEQIHMRKVLDDDIREVKKIQEMLFEDEEADGVGRQRKFRWKNAESGFSLDDPAGGAGADNGDEVDSADDEEERKWRTMRFEREQFLLKKSKEEIIADVSTTEIGKRLLRTIEADTDFVVEKEEIKIKEYKAPSFLIQERDHSILRNSLLKYDQEVLAKMAESITKSGDYDRDENQEGFHKKASKTGNFVFVPLTKEQVEMRKRRAEEIKEGNAPKKTKVCTKQLFLDGLLNS